jgi:ankyrin repeat protein
MSDRALLQRVTRGRTDLVFDLVGRGAKATARDENGVPLLRWCAYYGDVSAVRFLLDHGESLDSLGDNLDLNGAAFHGHWRLVEFLVERGADVNRGLPDTGETPLHAALCRSDRLPYDLVLKVLLAAGAKANVQTRPAAETGAFMRDSRTRAETPLHRAAAFGTEGTIRLLLDAGAAVDARDMNGDTPLSWASWYGRPAGVLRLLCYGPHRIQPDYGEGLRANLLGDPTRPGE